MNGAALVAIAVIGLANGVLTDNGVVWWRWLLYPLLGVVAYLHGRRLPVRYGWQILTVVTVVGVAVAGAIGAWEIPAALMSLTVSAVLPWLAGRFRRQQAELVVAGTQRVAQLEREQEFVAERARLRERARIATDMHDSLGHELALIALRAGSLELSPDMTDTNRQAAEQLRVSAVAATDRLRATIGMLREDAAPELTQQHDETVDALVERAVAAGMPVEFRDDSEPVKVSALVERAVHRVVQESLTNATRYAPGAAVTVEVTRRADLVTVSVVNTPPDQPVMNTSGSGSGLLGLAERVRLAGGSLRAGPAAGGFSVEAVFPSIVLNGASE